MIWCCCGCGVGWQLKLQFIPPLVTYLAPSMPPKKKKKKKKKKKYLPARGWEGRGNRELVFKRDSVSFGEDEQVCRWMVMVEQYHACT